MRLAAYIAITVVALTPAPGSAQVPAVRTDTLVRIVAIVGDSIITNGELDQALEVWASTNQQLPPPPGPALDSLVERLLSDRIEGLLLVQAAQRDTSISVSDDDIRSGVDAQVASVQANYPSRAEFESALSQANLTLQEYRSMLTVQLRQQRLISEYMGRQMRDRKPPPISDAEIRQAFDEQVRANAGPPMLPPSITFEQVVVPVTPSDTALRTALAKTDSILELIRAQGQDFAALARRFSEDPGSRDLGGDLGWFRPGQMFAPFERMAYGLRPGEISDPVLTPAGYHIIRLERVRGPERQARHILIRPVLLDEDQERARTTAEQVADALRGGASIDSLRRAFGDRDEPARLGPIDRDSMPSDYMAALSDVGENDVVGPFGYGMDGPIPKWAVVRVERVEPARPATVEDYRTQLQQLLGRTRLQEEILAELRRSTYIEIRRAGTASRN